jgi:hypothetical protein
MLDSRRQKSCQGTQQRFLGSAHLAITLAHILALWLWVLMKMGLFMDPFQQPLLKGKKLKVPGARNGVHQGRLSQALTT